MRLTNEAEYDAAMALVEAVNRMCFPMWTAKHFPSLIDPKTKFYSELACEKSQIWNMACAAWEHINGEDAAMAAEQCAEYRANPRFNPDPSADYKRGAE